MVLLREAIVLCRRARRAQGGRGGCTIAVALRVYTMFQGINTYTLSVARKRRKFVNDKGEFRLSLQFVLVRRLVRRTVPPL